MSVRAIPTPARLETPRPCFPLKPRWNCSTFLWVFYQAGKINRKHFRPSKVRLCEGDASFFLGAETRDFQNKSSSRLNSAVLSLLTSHTPYPLSCFFFFFFFYFFSSWFQGGEREPQRKKKEKPCLNCAELSIRLLIIRDKCLSAGHTARVVRKLPPDNFVAVMWPPYIFHDLAYQSHFQIWT